MEVRDKADLSDRDCRTQWVPATEEAESQRPGQGRSVEETSFESQRLRGAPAGG